MIKNDLLRSYKKYHRKICAISKPLEFFGVDRFWRWSQKYDGSFSLIGNCLDVAEDFFDRDLHLEHPYFRHPRFFKDGYALPDLFNSPEWEKTQGKQRGSGKCNHVLMRVQTQQEGFVGFGFASSKVQLGFETFYLNYLHRFDQFVNYFENNAAGVIREVEADGINISSFVGDKFQLKPRLCHTIASSDCEIQFLASLEGKSLLSKAIYSLTKTEKICLYYYLSGYTAKEIGKKLYRSSRTIETHLQNSKAKLNVTSRSELFEILEPFHKFLLK